MNTEQDHTEFASPERFDKEGVDRQARLVSVIPLLCRHFDAVPDIVLILNQHRQIVYANSAIVAKLGLLNRGDLYREKRSFHGVGLPQGSPQASSSPAIQTFPRAKHRTRADIQEETFSIATPVILFDHLTFEFRGATRFYRGASLGMMG
jgi:hypothetical protein